VTIYKVRVNNGMIEPMYAVAENLEACVRLLRIRLGSLESVQSVERVAKINFGAEALKEESDGTDR